MRTLKTLTLLFIVNLFFPSTLFAEKSNQFITVVNPVRISQYTPNPKESIKAQYEIVLKNDLPATWLLTYDAIENDGIYSVLQSMNENQEVGIFLEVTPNFAKDSGVSYNDTGSWHHATSVFLSGYVQEDRIKLVDTVFNKFKKRFGHYPTSVGSWWTDSFSLSYMQKKYGVTANLGCADQFSTDGYKIWGQYWSTPFYPSKYHAGIPASDESVKLDVVNLQWASRDPLNGYVSSLYSTQDYHVGPLNFGIDYFEKLIDLYARKHGNQFGQITVGLEGDLEPGAYKKEFKKQLEVVKRLNDSGEFKVTTMNEFSKWYRKNFTKLSPVQIIEANDFLSKPAKVIWYQSPNLRLGIRHDLETQLTTIFDFRSYHFDLQEPYFQSPNKEINLSINTPSYFDEISQSENVWSINLGELRETSNSEESFNLVFSEGEMILKPDGIVVKGIGVDVPFVLSGSPALSYSRTDDGIKIEPKTSWIVGREGYVFRDLTDVATHHLARKRTIAIILGLLFIFVAFGILIRHSKISERKKLVLLTLVIVLPLIYCAFWYQKNTVDYYVSQAEIDALYRLSIMPEGKVVVVDKECLGCEWNTNIKPAVFANKRNYVRKYGRHPIVYNLSVFEAKDQRLAKEEFDKLNARYIYLAKYEDYIEKVPFSPGDLGIEKIYDNANAEVWRIKNPK